MLIKRINDSVQWKILSLQNFYQKLEQDMVFFSLIAYKARGIPDKLPISNVYDFMLPLVKHFRISFVNYVAFLILRLLHEY